MADSISIDAFGTDEAPFEGMTNDDFRSMNSLIEKRIEILDTKQFENGNGEGVFIKLFNGEESPVYTCTHGQVIVKKLKNGDVLRALSQGKTITAKVVQRKSTTSTRLVYDLVA